MVKRSSGLEDQMHTMIDERVWLRMKEVQSHCKDGTCVQRPEMFSEHAKCVFHVL